MELLLIILVYQTYQVLSLPIQQSQSALVGSNVIIPCTFSNDPRVDRGSLSISWSFQGKEILHFDGSEKPSDPRFSLHGDSTNGQASLSIRNVSIEDEGTYRCSVKSHDTQEIQLYVRAPPYLTVTKKTVVEKEESLLRCSATGFYPKQIIFIWTRGGQTLQEHILHHPVQMANGTYSETSEVSITMTKESEKQDFSCGVNHTSLEEPIQKNFKIILGDAPSFDIHHQNFSVGEEQTLVCKVWGFYPQSIVVKWFLNGTHEKKDSVRRLDPSDLESSYNFKPTCKHNGVIISCQVEHDTLPAPRRKNVTVHLEECVGPAPASRLRWGVLAAILLLLLITGICCCKCICRYYKLKQATKLNFKVNHISGPKKLLHGSEIKLECIACYDRKNLKVQWFEVKSWKETNTSQITFWDDKTMTHLYQKELILEEESERLLHKTYLSFKASIKYHRDVTLICRASYNNETREEAYTCRDIFAKANQKPLRKQICESGDVEIILGLESFFPKKIYISWNKTGDHYQLLPQWAPPASTESFHENEDGTFNVESVYRIPGDYLKRSNCDVTVTWNILHKENKIHLQTIDFPWRPNVGDILIPPVLLINEDVSLECLISDYFPDDLTVRWYKMRNGIRELLPEDPGGNYKIQHERNEQEDKTFKCCTSVRFTPTLAGDQGAEFICEVRHPLLEEPIETSTGKLKLLGRPEVDGITMLEDFKTFSLTLDKFYPCPLGIQWQMVNMSTEESTNLPGSVDTTCNHDGSFQTVSICKPPIDRILPNQKYEMRAEISHESISGEKRKYQFERKAEHCISYIHLKSDAESIT